MLDWPLITKTIGPSFLVGPCGPFDDGVGLDSALHADNKSAAIDKNINLFFIKGYL